MPTLFIKNLATTAVVVADPTGYDQSATVITVPASSTVATELTSFTYANMEGSLAALAAAGTIDYFTSSAPVYVARYVAAAPINLATNGLTPVDTGAIVAGDIILCTDQSAASANGLYVASAGVWTRLAGPNGEGSVSAGEIIQVLEGTVYAATQWSLTTKNPIAVGTTSLTFTQSVGTAAASGTTYNDTTFVASVGSPSTVQAGIDALKHYIPLALADPGTGAAIPVTRSATVSMVVGSSGAETNTLDIPTFIGQVMVLAANTVGTGTRAVTTASAYDHSAHTHITFSAAGQSATLASATVSGALAWILVSNNGTTLS